MATDDHRALKKAMVALYKLYDNVSALCSTASAKLPTILRVETSTSVRRHVPRVVVFCELMQVLHAAESYNSSYSNAIDFSDISWH